ncbi:MAG: phosphoribosyltransferase [Novosphingobium sp. 28-62-57]|uniref:phosphoribosyltransferase n=1 Tax=unclassified Novosphingobium TaxID=2644732 RepID=UPI000BD8D614|nr:MULTISPECIES: phosphoribosyltransferase family protein [unclassified Novosphingobium]OYW49942.1 MAG: phosphoribosyltransferase [Novosphingobium sp. 12-62-10]OYZ12096.1 MAG: phosphoribosyltransferase [Novosphingobium sp. 28-62-57]OZA39199.1 MAG: phosphoribosyltransferase [Novosphingobium sp. 17-62-9]HQS68667.1 phosphoribosyltransferase family protein [Novosphingobium sp.]
MIDSAAPVLNYIAYEDFLTKVRGLSRTLAADRWKPDFIIGIGRGGLVPAVYISHELQVPMLSVDHSSKVPGFADELLGKVAGKSADGTRLLFVDDINDSGGTIVYIRNLLAENGCNPDNLRFAVLMDNCRSQARVDYAAEEIDRAQDKRWFVFPWEAVMTAETLAEEAQAVPERLA